MRFGRWSLPVAMVIALLLHTVSALAKTTIRVYHRDELREVEWIKQVKATFEAANPDIEVELVQGIGGGGAQYAERLAVLWAAGNAPDVFYGSTDKAGYILNGWARDVTPLIARDRKAMDFDDFFPGIFNASMRKGKNYGVPAIAMAQAIFYNKRLFAEAGLAPPPVDWNDPGWSWNTFVQYAEKLTRFDPSGRATQVGVSGVGLSDVAWMAGADWFPAEAYETGIATRATLVNSEISQAYGEVQRLYVEKGAAAAGPRSGVSGWDGFWGGKVGMDWTGWWKVRNYVDIKENGGMNFEWGIAPLPRLKSRSNTRWSDPWFISSVTKHPEEAWRFVRYVTSAQGETSFARHVAFPPSRRSALGPYIETITKASGMTRVEALTALSGALEHSRAAADESIGGMSVVEPIIDAEMDPMLQGERGVNDALEQAQRRVNAALQELAARWAGK